jgi:predicted transcriptional regulator
MPTISCKVPESLAAKLSHLAKRERCSKASLLREALKALLESHRPRADRSAFDLAKDLCGTLKGGPSDLTTNPKYMEGFGQ